jgi:hypothetical protein
VGGDALVDSETLLVTDFVNLKINPTQSFECAHISRVCVHMFIWMSAHTCMSIYIYTVFKKRVVVKFGKQLRAYFTLLSKQ